MRLPLRRKLETAWESSIHNDYLSRRINSERSLQASLWSELNKNITTKSWQIFFEPSFRVATQDESKQLIPDLVICNSKEIVCVIEIKYTPRIRPPYQKDLETLELLAKYKKQLYLSNKRFRGIHHKEKAYPFSEKTLFVWAGIHAETSPSHLDPYTPSFALGINALEGCYMQMHAETRIDRPPRIETKRY